MVGIRSVWLLKFIYVTIIKFFDILPPILKLIENVRVMKPWAI